MLVERSYLTIRDGQEAAFAAMMAAEGLPLLRALPGSGGVRFGPGVENPSTSLLLIEWDNMAAHHAFNAAPIYPRFRELLRPFTIGGAMEHFELE